MISPLSPLNLNRLFSGRGRSDERIMFGTMPKHGPVSEGRESPQQTARDTNEADPNSLWTRLPGTPARCDGKLGSRSQMVYGQKHGGNESRLEA